MSTPDKELKCRSTIWPYGPEEVRGKNFGSLEFSFLKWIVKTFTGSEVPRNKILRQRAEEELQLRERILERVVGKVRPSLSRKSSRSVPLTLQKFSRRDADRNWRTERTDADPEWCMEDSISEIRASCFSNSPRPTSESNESKPGKKKDDKKQPTKIRHGIEL